MIHVTPAAITAWGGEAVFANVLLTRLGVPVPAVPVLVLAGSAIAHGTLSFTHVLFAAVLAAHDRRRRVVHGGPHLRASAHQPARALLAIDRSSVQTTRALFERFGAPIMAMCKFVPGLALITPPLMGTTRIPR